jgi:fructokinase
VIVSLGESVVDFTPTYEDGHLTGFRLHPGGSPYNVAVALARLGRRAGFAGRLSTDLFGAVLVRHLSDEGVDLRLVRRGPEPNVLAFLAFDGQEAIYSFRGDGAADGLLTPDDLDPAEFVGLEALHFGSLILGREPSGSSIRRLVMQLRGKVPLSFDPNLRPDLAEDWARYRQTVVECGRATDLLKVSERDLEVWASRGGGSLLEALAGGPAVVVVTRGERGSRLHRDGRTLDCPALPCDVVDTVGAGDAFSAGVLAALADHGALERDAMAELTDHEWFEVLRFASASAALCCEREGADPPTRAAVIRRLALAGA